MRKEEKHLKEANASLSLVRFGCSACCGLQGGRSLVLEVHKSLWQEYGLPFYATQEAASRYGLGGWGRGTLVISGVAPRVCRAMGDKGCRVHERDILH